MSEKYDEYIKEHKENVQKGFEWLKTNLPEVMPSDMFEMSVLENAIIPEHDKSKYDKEEYDAYDAYFYGGNKSFEVVEEFNRAWLHHIHMNHHHWQHWILINDDPGEGEIILDMPDVYIIEMICDWWAFSHKSGNLYEIFEWYKSHKKNMILHENTKKFIEELLDKIKKELDKEKTVI
jgi:hypothetical protein